MTARILYDNDLPGDVDGNGQIDATDNLIILRRLYKVGNRKDYNYKPRILGLSALIEIFKIVWTKYDNVLMYQD